MRLRRKRTTRRRGSSRPTSLVLSTGVLVVLLAIFLLYVAFKAPTGIPLKPYYDVNVQFSSLGTLSQGANVSIAGNFVGEAVDMKLVHGVPTAKLELSTSTPKLPVDTTARIRPRGLLGAEFIDLVPGHSKRTIASGGTIRAGQTSTAEQLSDLLSTFDAPTRQKFGEMLRGLGEGVLGRGPQLNQLLGQAPRTLQDLSRGLAPTLARTGATARLIGGTEALMAAMDPVRHDIANGFGKGADALAPFAQEQGSISQLLDVAPAAFSQIRTSLSTGDTALAHLTTFANNTTQFTALAPRALSSLTHLLVNGRRPMRDATALLRATRPAINPTLEMTGALNPELPHLNRLFGVLEQPVVTLGRYACDFEGFAHNWRGFLGLGSKLQSGPLGPYTILRTELSGPGLQTPNLNLPHDGGQSDSFTPCVTVKAGY